MSYPYLLSDSFLTGSLSSNFSKNTADPEFSNNRLSRNWYSLCHCSFAIVLSKFNIMSDKKRKSDNSEGSLLDLLVRVNEIPFNYSMLLAIFVPE